MKNINLTNAAILAEIRKIGADKNERIEDIEIDKMYPCWRNNRREYYLKLNVYTAKMVYYICQYKDGSVEALCGYPITEA